MTKLLELVDKTLDQVPLSVEPSVVFARLLTFSARWDHRQSTGLFNEGHQRVGVVTAVSHHMRKLHSRQQSLRLGDVVALPCCQAEAQRVTQPVHGDMNFGAKSASASSQPLGLLTTTFFVRQPNKDARGRWCCPLSHSPYPGRWRNAPSSLPKFPPHTSVQSVYRRYSSSHILLVASAIVLHYDLSTAPLPGKGGIFEQNRRTPVSGSAILSGRRGLSSTVHPVVSLCS
jgi:hypothetical protein